MAGFVLVPLAACLVLTILSVIERGKVLPVDRTGTFWLQPLEDAEDPVDFHPEVMPWAWLDQAPVSDQETKAAAWAVEMDGDVGSYAEQEERWAALCAAHDETTAALEVPIADLGYAAWNEAVEHQMALARAARAGWKWSVNKRGGCLVD